jgi:hypothetical protein
MNVGITDYIPDEEYFSRFLQNSISFRLGTKILKKGRLILFRRAHFCIHFIVLSDKGNRETLEVPLPFKTDIHLQNNTIHFDYRITTLANNNKEIETALRDIRAKSGSPSQFYDKVLEINIT